MLRRRFCKTEEDFGCSKVPFFIYAVFVFGLHPILTAIYGGHQMTGLNATRYAKCGLAAAAAMATVSGASAAAITWGAASSFTADTDIISGAVATQAVNGGNDTATVGGLVFEGHASSGGAFTAVTTIPSLVSYNAAPNAFAAADYDTYSIATGNGDLDTVLSTHAYDAGDDGAIILTLNGLTVGAEYSVQLVAPADNRNATIAARTVTLDGQTSLVRSNGTAVEFAVGTFTADAATQAITIDGSNGGGYSALVLAQETVPEPGSLALLGLGGLMIVRRRRG